MSQQETYTLNGLLKALYEFETKTPIYVEVTRHDENGWVTHRCLVPVYYVSGNYDGNGIRLKIDESKIKMEEWR